MAGTSHTEESKQKWFGTGSTSWYKRIQPQLFCELCGESSFLPSFLPSFLQEYMGGEASYESCRVTIANWELEARIAEQAPLSIVTAKDARLRAQNVANYRGAVVALKQLLQPSPRYTLITVHQHAPTTYLKFKDAYSNALAEASTVIAASVAPSSPKGKGLLGQVATSVKGFSIILHFMLFWRFVTSFLLFAYSTVTIWSCNLPSSFFVFFSSIPLSHRCITKPYLAIGECTNVLEKLYRSKRS
jgi:hypothetical protein